jgi:PPM family protein phosphatase
VIIEAQMEINWRSQQGKKTNDNRDCGGVAVRGDSTLCLVADGSTSGPTSGDLARQLIRDVIDWYVVTGEAATVENVMAQLRRAHLILSRRFSRDSASYLLACIVGAGTAFVLHAGDCLLGLQKGNSPTRWFIRPHTLANVTGDLSIDDISKTHVRHQLTRSFRAREFMPPDVSEFKIEVDGSLVVATDGFWAELSAEDQTRFMQGHDVPMTDDGDDRSCFQIQCRDEPGIKIQFDEKMIANLYIRGLDDR